MALEMTNKKLYRPDHHPSVKSGQIGVLLVNLGTPDATDYWSMRRYLKQFLSDRRVIELNRIAWWLILNLIILSVRPSRKGRDYDKIWNRDKNESPLKTVTRSQAEKLGKQLSEFDPRIITEWAMRYGNPSIESKLRVLVEQGCDRILLVPLYPQYAAATTATVYDETSRILAKMRWQPSLRVAPPYYDNPVYIDAISQSIKSSLSRLPFTPERIIASFHGMPQEYLEKGDPYYCQCAKTARLLKEALRQSSDRFLMSFQSRFGRAEWLKPYTDSTVIELAKSGVKSIAVVSPGFSADCLETLEEIAMENAELFKEAGGENFFAIPCLNDSDDGIRVIHDVTLNELKGWAQKANEIVS